MIRPRSLEMKKSGMVRMDEGTLSKTKFYAQKDEIDQKLGLNPEW